MRRAAIRFALLLLVTIRTAAAVASVYSDDLDKCLASHTSADDKNVFVQWMFVAMARHPAVQQYVSITEEQRRLLSEKVTALYSRLLTDSCRREAVAALKYDAPAAVASSVRWIDEVFANPAVSQAFDLGAIFKADDKIKALFKEAGVAAILDR